MKAVSIVLFLACSAKVTWANEPTMEKNRTCDGYQILTEKNGLQLKMGMKAGDTIKSFDGKTVSSPQQAMDLYNKLDTVGKHEIIVERNGKIEKIKYEIAQLFKPLQ